MKRIFSIISALVLLVATSCVKEEFATFDPALSTAPAVTSFEQTDDAIIVEFTPAKMNVNPAQVPSHTLALVSLNGTSMSKNLTAANKDGKLTIKKTALSQVLVDLGCAEEQSVAIEMVVRAALSTKIPESGNGFMDSNGKVSISDFVVALPAPIEGNPWEEYTEPSPWGVIGSFNEWGGDVAMYTDGSKHVAMGVSFEEGTEFKVRKDGGWDVNYGFAEGVDSYKIGEAFGVGQDGANIKVAATGKYDILLDPDAETMTIFEAYDPYPDFAPVDHKETTGWWGITGAISNYEISWDKDIDMYTDGSKWLALGVDLVAGDEFKFRQDAAWTVNLGYGDGVSSYALDSEFALGQDGPNIEVAADGCYDIMLDPDAGTATITNARGGGKSGVIGADNPGPGPQPITGWNIIGLNGDWENDILATQDGNTWTAYITANDDTEFKWRKDGGWDEDYGGVMVALGEPFDAVAGGDNIKVPAGFYKVVLDTEALKITVFNGDVWSLIGVNGDWENDIDMSLVEGKWISPLTAIAGEFKLRRNHAWDDNRGGVMVAIGEPFEAVAGGDNIKVEGGSYVVTYDPEAETITVDETGWGLVGTINGWGGTPDIILKADGNWLVAKNVALTADDEIKIRYNSSWDVNRGGATMVGHIVKAVPGGDNIKPGVAGTYDVYYREESEVIAVIPAGETFNYWGVVGTINEWGGTPDFVMYEDENGNFHQEGIEIANTDEIKIRENEAWDNNRGGNFEAVETPFTVEPNGPNIKIGKQGTIDILYNPNEETMTIWGELTDGPDIQTGSGWSLIGVNGDWETDIDMKEEGGKWVSPATAISGEFKLRFNHDWSENRGGTLASIGEPFEAVAGGDNINVEEGTYVVTYDPENETILVEVASAASWGVVGTINSWGGEPDVPMVAEGNYLVAKGITLTADDEIKIRYNNSWDVNFGGVSMVGHVVKAVSGGDNIKPGEDGEYDIYFYEAAQVLAVLKSGEAFTYWGIVGTINGWGGTPDYVMYANEDGLLVYEGLALNADDEIKIREKEDWTNNRGGVFAEFGTAFDALSGGDNIKVGKETTVDVLYDLENETITITEVKAE